MLVEIDCVQIRNRGTDNEERLRDYSDTQDWDAANTTADVYKAALKEFGRCVSKIYRDNEDKTARHIGWVFEKRVKFSDCNEYYIQEVWLVPLISKETKTFREYALK